MFDPNDPLTLGTSLDLYRGCLIKCSLPDDDESAVFTVGDPQNNFEICLHDEALRTFVRLADLALSKMSSTEDGPQASEQRDEHTHHMKHLGWVCIDDDCPMDYVIQSPEQMFFRIGRSTKIEVGFDVQPLQRFAELATQAVAALDALPAEEEDAAA